MKKTFSIFIITLLVLTTLSSVSAEEYTYNSQDLGVVTVDVSSPSWFDKLFSNEQPLTIVTSNDAGKETANFAPAEKVNVKLGIEYGECNPREALFYLRKIGDYNTPIIQTDLSQDVNIKQTGSGCGFSVEVRTSFTAPNTEGKYEVSYAVKDNTGKIVKKETKEVIIAKTITTCPQNKCTDWKFLSPAGDGQSDSRECYTYSSAPACTEKRSTEYRTTCEEGAVISGTHDKVSNKGTSYCVSAVAPTSCVPLDEACNNKDDDCDNFVDEGLTCTTPESVIPPPTEGGGRTNSGSDWTSSLPFIGFGIILVGIVLFWFFGFMMIGIIIAAIGLALMFGGKIL